MIIDPIDSAHAIIRIQGQELLVETRQVNLPRNQEVTLQVEEVQPQVILKILPEEIPPGREVGLFLKKFLAADVPLDQLAEKLSGLWKIPQGTLTPEVQENLNQLLVLLMSFEPSSGDWTRLQNILGQAGFFLETRLKHLIEGRTPPQGHLWQEDLKILVKKLRGQLDALLTQEKVADRSLIEELGRALENLADKIELYQILNVPRDDSQERFLLFLPLWVANHLQFAELSFSFPRKETPEERPGELSLLFLLHFPDWGRMRIAVQIHGQKLYGFFSVTDPEVKNILERAFPDLSAHLTRLGFEPHFQTSVESPEKMSLSLIPEIESGADSLLSIVV